MKTWLSLALALLMITGSMVIGVNASEEPAVQAPEVIAYQTTDLYVDIDMNCFYDVRFIAKVGEWITDSNGIGFTITTTADGEEYSWEATSHTVYKSLTAKGTQIMTAESQGATALIAMTITGVPAELGDLDFTVTPFVLDAAQDRIDGETGTDTVRSSGYKLTVAGSTVPSRSNEESYGSAKIFDGDTNTTWRSHSRFQFQDDGSANVYFRGYSFAADLGSRREFDTLKLYSGNTIKNVKVYATNDDNSYKALVNNEYGHVPDWDINKIASPWVLISDLNEGTEVALTHIMTLKPTTVYRYVWVTFELTSEYKQSRIQEAEFWNLSGVNGMINFIDSYSTAWSQGPAAGASDGDLTTFWRTLSSDQSNGYSWIQYKFPNKIQFDGFTFIEGKDRFNACKIEVSDDGINWTTVYDKPKAEIPTESYSNAAMSAYKPTKYVITGLEASGQYVKITYGTTTTYIAIWEQWFTK